MLAELPDDLAVVRRRGGEVEDAVAAGAALAVNLVEQFTESRVAVAVDELGLVVVNPLREILPDGLLHGADAGELIDPRLHLIAERLAADRTARDADDGEATGQEALARQV